MSSLSLGPPRLSICHQRAMHKRQNNASTLQFKTKYMFVFKTIQLIIHNLTRLYKIGHRSDFFQLHIFKNRNLPLLLGLTDRISQTLHRMDEISFNCKWSQIKKYNLDGLIRSNVRSYLFNLSLMNKHRSHRSPIQKIC